MRKRLFMLAGCALFAIPGFCEAEITAVNCTPRYPWNGKVDVDVTLANTESDAEYVVSLALVRTDGSEKDIVTLDTEPVVKGNGVHTLVWDAATDCPNTRLTGVAVKATIEKYDGSQGVYLVFDLSEGKDAQSYPHRYTLQAPDLSSDVCRTTELWMRRVPAGTFGKGNPNCLSQEDVTSHTFLPYHQVTLTRPYYLGIFEVTQQQYFQMEGTWPSFFSNVTYRATRPVEKIGLQVFRGNNSQYGWYDDGTELGTSPLLRLRQKTGFVTMDLPSHAQWERANRAGLTHKYNRPDVTDANAKYSGRNSQDNVTVAVKDVTGDTPPADGGTAVVGSYPPNPWGFYDMGGNVYELSTSGYPYAKNMLPQVSDFAGSPYVDLLGPTPEWCERSKQKVTDATGATICGGGWSDGPTAMLVYYAYAIARSITGGSQNYAGIRLCITCK